MRARLIVIALFAVVGLAGCGKSMGTAGETVNMEMTSWAAESSIEPETETGTEAPAQEAIPVIYEDDELINLYLSKYNDVNDEPIAREDFEIYHHHGKDHKDQIILSPGDVEEVVITDNIGSDIEIVVQGAETEDAYKPAFIRYARAYDEELSTEQLEEYWKQIVTSSDSFIQFDEFEVYIQFSYNDSIEFFKISGNVE